MTMVCQGRAITLTTTRISKATSRQTMSTIWKGTSINFSFNVLLFLLQKNKTSSNSQSFSTKINEGKKTLLANYYKKYNSLTMNKTVWLFTAKSTKSSGNSNAKGWERHSTKWLKRPNSWGKRMGTRISKLLKSPHQ